MLTDDSAVEQKAVREAFEGEDVQHLLCHIHAKRTLRKKVKAATNRDCLGHMLLALKYRRTEAGCRESIAAAKASVLS